MPLLGYAELSIVFYILRPEQSGVHFADDILKCILLIENIRILIQTSLEFVPMDPIHESII